MPELDKNHENLSESGPYGSVWDNIQPEWILQGLGSLWDTSRALKPPGKIKIVGFRRLAEIPPIRPYFPGLGNRILSLQGGRRQITLVALRLAPPRTVLPHLAFHLTTFGSMGPGPKGI